MLYVHTFLASLMQIKISFFKLFQVGQVPKIMVVRGNPFEIGDSEYWSSSSHFVSKCEYTFFHPLKYLFNEA